MAKRSPEKVLEALDAAYDAAIDAEVERALAMTPEEHEKELRAAGIDVEAEKAKALEWHAKAARGELPEAKAAKSSTSSAEPPATDAAGTPAGALVPITRAPSRRLRWTAGLAMAATLAALYASSLGGGVGGGNPGKSPAELRQDARDACNHSHWKECLKDLDDADRLDPAGATDPANRSMREAAQVGLQTNAP